VLKFVAGLDLNPRTSF